MTLITIPTSTDDSGTKTDGTVVNAAYIQLLIDTVDDQTHSTTNPTVKPKTITDEVITARGSEASLDARLDESLNADGSLNIDVVTRLTTNSTQTGNVGLGEDTLFSYTVPADTLTEDGQVLEFEVWGVTANNVDTKTLKVYFGATAFGSHVLTASSAALWCMRGHIVRTGAATQIAREVTTHTLTAPTAPVGGAAPAETLSGAVILKVTGETNAATNNNIVGVLFIVKKLG